MAKHHTPQWHAPLPKVTTHFFRPDPTDPTVFRCIIEEMVSLRYGFVNPLGRRPHDSIWLTLDC